MPPLLLVRSVDAGDGRVLALRQVSLVVPPRAVVALLGANGAGKSTLLRTISGEVRPGRGRIELGGRRIDGLSDHAVARRGVVHIPEGRGVFPHLTVAENVVMAARGSDDPFGALEGTFPVLAQRRNQLAGTLSGGEQQMLSMARALVTSPRLLMLDELSLGLAPIVVSQIYEAVERIRESGVSILLVEQYVRYALRLADLVVILHRGRVVFIGEPAEVAKSTALLESYLGQGRSALRLESDDGH